MAATASTLCRAAQSFLAQRSSAASSAWAASMAASASRSDTWSSALRTGCQLWQQGEPSETCHGLAGTRQRRGMHACGQRGAATRPRQQPRWAATAQPRTPRGRNSTKRRAARPPSRAPGRSALCLPYRCLRPRSTLAVQASAADTSASLSVQGACQGRTLGLLLAELPQVGCKAHKAEALARQLQLCLTPHGGHCGVQRCITRLQRIRRDVDKLLQVGAAACSEGALARMRPPAQNELAESRTRTSVKHSEFASGDHERSAPMNHQSGCGCTRRFSKSTCGHGLVGRGDASTPVLEGQQHRLRLPQRQRLGGKGYRTSCTSLTSRTSTQPVYCAPVSAAHALIFRK